MEQWQIRRKNSQVRSILCSYGNQVETALSSCGYTCTHLGILIAGQVEEKEEPKNLLMWGEFSLQQHKGIIRLQEHPSFCSVFSYVIFYKKVIVLYHGDYNFLF